MDNATIARITGIVLLALAAFHYFNVWGVMIVAGLAICNKV